VTTAATMREALHKKTWDFILADHSLPRFSGEQALALLKETGLDLPFILVSGSIDEATAVAMMKAGAQDYVLKHQLARLVPAMHRELREAGVRSEKKQMQEHLLVTDRLASLGTLAACIAHEINNPLSVTLAQVDFVHEKLEHVAQKLRAMSDPTSLEIAQVINDLREPVSEASLAAGLLYVI